MCTAILFGLMLVPRCAVQRKLLLFTESDCDRLRSEDVLLSDPSEDGEDGNRTEDVRPALLYTILSVVWPAVSVEVGLIVPGCRTSSTPMTLRWRPATARRTTRASASRSRRRALRAQARTCSTCAMLKVRLGVAVLLSQGRDSDSVRCWCSLTLAALHLLPASVQRRRGR